MLRTQLLHLLATAIVVENLSAKSNTATMIDESVTLNYKVAYAHGEMNPKKRHTMEDVHRVLPSLEDLPLYSYFGVYDGEF